MDTYTITLTKAQLHMLLVSLQNTLNAYDVILATSQEEINDFQVRMNAATEAAYAKSE